MTDSALPPGSWTYRNWKACLSGEAELLAEEVPLYSDGWFTGELREGLGPFEIINTVAGESQFGRARSVLVLRASTYLGDDDAKHSRKIKEGRSRTESFVGGLPFDEVVSLLSLAHGVRLAAGGANRVFWAGQDIRGRPENPAGGLPHLQTTNRHPAIPSLLVKTSLQEVLLSTYPSLEWESARAIALASRNYREAVWLADSDPSLAWLLLISAAETAANEWARLQRVPSKTPAELLSEMKPDFESKLREASLDRAEDVLGVVGEALVDVLKSQWKFSQFLRLHTKSRIEPRPEHNAIDWSDGSLKKILNTVYALRSQALHTGKPFPPPMSLPPGGDKSEGGDRAYHERPGGSTYTGGGFWLESDLPINLHAFEHIVRTSICAWWLNLAYPTTGAS